jgi:hypothetical protein
MAAERCARCGRVLGRGFVFPVDQGSVLKCLRCALRHGPMQRRSLRTCLVMGTVLTAINQGTLIVVGSFPPALLWKIPLTYCVPFCVATWGALSNSVVRGVR